jgi:uncharacterized metal-binding protein YceD (DUF177 family)
MAETVWSVPVQLAEVPDTGLHVKLEAPEPVRARLAELAGLRAMSELTATFDVTHRGAGLHVGGQVKAQVEQSCVVTMEPLGNAIDEKVDLLFVPGVKPRAEGETDDLPEPLINGRIDLGAIATEFLVLGIDPYPRKPGVAFEGPTPETNGAHPFAALAALKKEQGGSQS